ncbi:cation diffusion facilitator family transporter [Mesorhizobium escarrei]|uniref:Cobalt-zinc-cadmium resistance protein n=1 Tax=Mesorhizobium escarrei TaxID=666018 RepID=A0ABM9DIL9_9HYPH|nr:cation diffusion facilitator family transporter [Mesorhizobium escarrei]CAH2396423.1 Cobalt-zinc-cadmium resistance protein [Mesorhizobium escarrei]
MNLSLKIATGSLGVSLIVLTIKYCAYVLTGSVALYSDALESIINVVTAVAAIVAIRSAARPADANHQFGHHKAEYLSAVVVGVMIIVAALAILREAYGAFLAPTPIDAPWSGLAVNTLATVLNAVWSGVLIRQGRTHRSAALVADGKHLLVDVVTSVGVLVGVVLVVLTGIEVLDAAIAALVALHVLWSGWGVVRESASGLMDEAAPAEELKRIRETISTNTGDAIETHDLRTRHAGKVTFIEFHLVVPGSMSVERSHEICDRLEAALKETLEGAIVTIHVEPEHKPKHVRSNQMGSFAQAEG